MDWERLARNRIHYTQLRMLEVMADGKLWAPVELSREIGHNLSNVAYHAQVLVGYGEIELVKTEPVRGTTVHFYQLVPSPAEPPGALAAKLQHEDAAPPTQVGQGEPKRGEPVHEVREDGVSVTRAHPDDFVEEYPLKDAFTRCPTCGTRCLVVSEAEGTSYYEPHPLAASPPGLLEKLEADNGD